MKINKNFAQLEQSYLFSRIAGRVGEYRNAHPDADIISLGIGDVTRPLSPVVVEAMRAACAEMGDAASFRGYAPEQGYPFFLEAICAEYARKGVFLEQNEVFVSDGAKSDIGNILDLFSADNIVLIPDPVYPVYVDSNRMAGRHIEFMDATEQNGFLPLPDDAAKADIIYLCSPNNPTGAVYTKEQLKRWVDYANKTGAIILFDAAYEAFVSDPDLPASILQIDGASTCAIEICSFSKTAGFTGVRCGYTVVPSALMRGGQSINRMWLRRQTTKFNGVGYTVQRGAAAVFSPQGRAYAIESIAYYRENARVIAQTLQKLSIDYTGGANSPYLWMRCPGGMDSWQFFDHLLNRAQIVGTPGAGFGKNGEGFFRLTAFGDSARTRLAMQRLEAVQE